jgi:hypothetical protein
VRSEPPAEVVESTLTVGRVFGVTAAEVAAVPDPSPFVATTEKRYALPFRSPETVQARAGAAAVHVRPSGDEVTV